MIGGLPSILEAWSKLLVLERSQFPLAPSLRRQPTSRRVPIASPRHPDHTRESWSNHPPGGALRSKHSRFPAARQRGQRVDS